jgi:hypothetical protein
MNYVGFVAGSGIPSGSTFNVDTSNLAAGKLGVQAGLSAGTSFPGGNQQLVIFTFQAAASIVTDTVLLVSFADQPVIRQVASPAAELLPANYLNGVVTVYTGFEGDANGNRSVTPIDYTLVGRIVAALSPITDPGQFMRVDCSPRATSGNGIISAVDWTQTGRYVVGLDPIQPIGGLGGAAQGQAQPGSAELTGGELSAQGLSDRALRLIGSATEVGQTVQVPVELVAEGNENTVSFSVSFDPAGLEYLSTAFGNGLPSGAQVILNTNGCSAGRFGALIGGQPGMALASGIRQLLVLSFRTKTAGDGTLEIRFADSPVLREIVSTDAQVLAGDYVNASILVGGGLLNVLKLDVSQITDAGTKLTMMGAPSGTCQILVSSNLVDWSELSTVTGNSSGLVEVWDSQAKHHPMRFYRAVTP